MERFEKSMLRKQRDYSVKLVSSITWRKHREGVNRQVKVSAKKGGILMVPAPTKFLPAGQYEILFSESVNIVKPDNDFDSEERK